MFFSEMEHCMFSKLKICKRSSASLYSCEPEGSAEQNFRVVVKGKYLLLKEKVHTQTLRTKAAQRKHIILQHLNEAGGWTEKIILYNLVGRHCTHVKRQTTLKKNNKPLSRLRGWWMVRKGSNTVHWWSLEAPNTCSSSLTKQAKN